MPTDDLPTYESPRPESGLVMRDFDYDLPERFIAQTPIEPRDAAKLLVATGPVAEHRHITDLPLLLRPDDVLVVNETRVIPARLKLYKESGGAVEVLLLDRDGDGSWTALVRPSKKVRSGTVLRPGPGLAVEITDVLDGGQRRVRLLDDGTGAVLDAAGEEAGLARYGVAPLPPYITTPLVDPGRYQTTFARLPGSSAAPTAGLHLTTAVLDACRAVGVEVHTVDLTVGLDTFRPVTADRPEDHEIHSERYSVPEATMAACERAQKAGGRVVAVGTTSVRALESAWASGEPTGRTRLFIYGGYRFRVVDLLLTNFHLPRSSLLLLVEAFAGRRWRELYALAQREDYRFLSFGDALLLSRGSGVSAL